MTCRPINLDDEEVRQILAGRQTQVRRPVWHPMDQHRLTEGQIRAEALEWGPCGKPGDELWVREAWFHDLDLEAARAQHEDAIAPAIPVLFYRATEVAPDVYRWMKSSTMPRWVSRLHLRVEAVRAHRISQIAEKDAAAEGVETGIPVPTRVNGEIAPVVFFNYRDAFMARWDGRFGRKHPWKDDPWVWAYTVARVEAT